MISEKILGTLNEGETRQVDFVQIEWFEHDKHLLRKKTTAGEEIGIRSGVPLRDGDILYEDENRVVAVELLPTELVRVHVSSMKEMGRLCFEIGNRHISLAVTDNSVTIPYDEPTYLYLKKLGFNAEKVTEKFTGYTECRGHAHTDAHGHEHSHDHGHHHHGE